MIHTFCFHEMKQDKDDPRTGILGAIMFATRTTVHTTNRATYAQLVFGHDAILNIKHESNQAYINK